MKALSGSVVPFARCPERFYETLQGGGVFSCRNVTKARAAAEGPMNTISIDLTDELFEARREVQSHCQSPVGAGMAQRRVNDDGDTELHMDNGEAYLFSESGVTRLR